MPHFPSEYVKEVSFLERGIGQRGDNALRRLHEKGFSVGIGLTEYYAGAIAVMSQQNHIREYCPNDSTEKRFGSLSSTARWLQKNGGRAMFLLLSNCDFNTRLEGYGWTGIEPSNELPDHPITSAYRLGERVLGKGLSKDFIQVVVSSTHSLYEPKAGIGLETWRSNPAATIYPKVGFVLITEAPDDELRPTLDSSYEDGQVLDRRMYMVYPDKLLEN